MSDLIDRLNEISRDAGANAAQSLGSTTTLDAMEQRITWGVRRRRIRAGVMSAACVAAVGVGAVALPPLLRDVDPALLGAPTPEAVHSTDGLTVYTSGDMEIISAKGSIVKIASPEPATFSAYAMPDLTKICNAIDPYDFQTGWEFTEPNVKSLFGLARVQAVTGEAVSTVPESGIAMQFNRDAPRIRLTFETDTGLAPHLSVRGYAVFWDAEGPVYYQSTLDAVPTVEIQGDGASQVAVFTTKPVEFSRFCPEMYKPGREIVPGPLTRYMVVDVFVNSRAGHATLIATHRSWMSVEENS